MNDLCVVRTSKQLQIRSGIDNLEGAIRDLVGGGEIEQTLYDGALQKGSDQCNHYHGEGVYVRSLLIPAGTCVIGKIHKQARVCLVLQGSCMFVDEFFSGRVKAPWIGEFQPGTKTAVYAITDTVWAACVGTDITDPIIAVDELSAKTYEDFERYARSLESQS